MSGKTIFIPLINLSGKEAEMLWIWVWKLFALIARSMFKKEILYRLLSGTSTIRGTDRLHTSGVSDQKEKNSGERGHAPVWCFGSHHCPHCNSDTTWWSTLTLRSKSKRSYKSPLALVSAETRKHLLSTIKGSSTSASPPAPATPTAAGCGRFFPQALPKHKSHDWGDHPSHCALGHEKNPKPQNHTDVAVSMATSPWDPRSSQLLAACGLPHPPAGREAERHRHGCWEPWVTMAKPSLSPAPHASLPGTSCKPSSTPRPWSARVTPPCPASR